LRKWVLKLLNTPFKLSYILTTTASSLPPGDLTKADSVSNAMFSFSSESVKLASLITLLSIDLV